ncbi:MAG: hypothetical protein ACJ74G_06310 [Blastocatellia bacterium]
MKIKLNMLIAAASLAALLLTGSPHAYAQTGQARQAAPDADLKPISDNVLTVKGMIFPKLPRPANAKGAASCCTVGDTRSQEVMWPHFEEQPVFPKGKVTYEGTSAYSPPSTCWVISTYNLSVTAALHASYNLTAVPSGYSFITSNQYQQTYEDVKELVLNMNILDKYKIDIVAKLKLFTNNYAAYAQSLSVSNDSLLLYVKLESAGLTKGRSWFVGLVRDTETCCPPEIKDPVALKTALTTWVTNTVNALPNKGKGTGIAVKPVDQKNL